MANISATFDSINYVGKDGRHLILTVKDVPVAGKNASKVQWALTVAGGAVLYYDTYCNIKINGKSVFFSNGYFDAAGYSGWVGSANHPNDTEPWIAKDDYGNPTEQTCAKLNFTISGVTGEIAHNKNGTKKIKIEFKVGIFYYVVADCGGTFELTKIELDKNAPSINSIGIDNIGYYYTAPNNYNTLKYQCQLYATASLNSSVSPSPSLTWWYRVKAGSGNYSSWKKTDTSQISNLGTSIRISVDELNPKTTYKFQWKTEKSNNGLSATSAESSLTTGGASILNYFNNIELKGTAAATKLNFSYTTYPCASVNYYNRLVLTKGSSSITLNLSNATGSVRSDSLTQADYQTLINWLGNSLSINITATLTTYNSAYSNQIGVASVKNITLSVDPNAAKPTIVASGYEDINSTIVNNITHDNQLLVSTGQLPEPYTDKCSSLRINGIEVTTHFGATISDVAITFNNITKNHNDGVPTSANFNYTWGDVDLISSGCITLTVTDSRGLKGSFVIPIKVYERGKIIKQKDYNYWYESLKSHWSAMNGNNNPYLYYFDYNYNTKSYDADYFMQEVDYKENGYIGTTNDKDAVLIDKDYLIRSTSIPPTNEDTNTMFYWVFYLTRLNGTAMSAAIYNAYTENYRIIAINNILNCLENKVYAGTPLIDNQVKTEIDANMKVINGVVPFNFTESMT